MESDLSFPVINKESLLDFISAVPILEAKIVESDLSLLVIVEESVINLFKNNKESLVDLFLERDISENKLFVNKLSAAVALVTSAAILAFVFTSSVVILLEREIVSFANLLESIAAVSLYFIPETDCKYGAIIPGIWAESNLILILFDKEIVSLPILFESISDVSLKFNLSPATKEVEAAKALTFLETNKVVAIVLSAVVVSCVIVVGRPIINGERIVLLEKVSDPASVANVPEIGKITLLEAVVVIVKSPIPLVKKLLAIEIVLSVLATPVPPFEPGKILEIVPEESENLEVSEVNE